jgi:hypothetical protein
VSADKVADLRKKLKLETKPRGNPPPTDMAHPGALTLTPANTDSRANGTPDAGKAAPADDTLR